MKKIIAALICLLALPASYAQHRRQGEQMSPEEIQAKREAEAKEYYADADTALYGVRYRFVYLYNKAKNLKYEEDRMVLVRPEITLDMSYEGLGENRWQQAHKGQGGGDPSLAYHLTPDYFFWRPESGRLSKVYRMVAEEYLLGDDKCDNDWKITDQTRQIGPYNCRMATLDKHGRSWTAWYTTDLDYKAAPRDFVGLPGVVLALGDSAGEVVWAFNGLLDNQPDSKLYIKYPDKLRTMSPEDFRTAVRIVALSDGTHLRDAGVWDMNPSSYPAKLRPATGIDALNIDNPIELE